MGEKSVEIFVSHSGEQSWDILWKWLWFIKDIWISNYWREVKSQIDSLLSLLDRLNVKSVLDCSCGLGFKTILLAKSGYVVEGSDGSVVAIRYAPQLAREKGINIRFFHSRWEELGEKCEYTYDCVFSDYFDEIETYRDMINAAKGIYSVLNRDGKFIFYGPSPKYKSKSDLKKLIEEEWRKRRRIKILPPYKKGGIRVISIEIAQKTSDGIRETHIFLIEKQDMMKAEIAFIMNPRIKWTFQDYAKVLSETGFKTVNYIDIKGTGFIVGVK